MTERIQVLERQLQASCHDKPKDSQVATHTGLDGHGTQQYLPWLAHDPQPTATPSQAARIIDYSESWSRFLSLDEPYASENVWALPDNEQDWFDDLEASDDPVLIDKAGSMSTSNAIDDLSTVLGNLHFDDSGGESSYLGPTSNLHLPRSSPPKLYAQGQPSIGHWIDAGLSIPPDHLLDLYWSHVHFYLPIFSYRRDAPRSPSALGLWDGFLYSQVLAAGAWFMPDDDPYIGHRLACIQFLQDQFDAALSKEISRICLTNVQAFALRSYLSIIDGRLDTANIFLGKSNIVAARQQRLQAADITYTGVACSMAKSIGLHVNPASYLNASLRAEQQRAQEERAASFWACFRLDRSGFLFCFTHIPCLVFLKAECRSQSVES